jgi:hypothetical protein
LPSRSASNGTSSPRREQRSYDELAKPELAKPVLAKPVRNEKEAVRVMLADSQYQWFYWLAPIRGKRVE